jgi:hypothetical protein
LQALPHENRARWRRSGAPPIRIFQTTLLLMASNDVRIRFFKPDQAHPFAKVLAQFLESFAFAYDWDGERVDVEGLESGLNDLFARDVPGTEIEKFVEASEKAESSVMVLVDWSRHYEADAVAGHLHFYDAETKRREDVPSECGDFEPLFTLSQIRTEDIQMLIARYSPPAGLMPAP